MKTLIWDFNGTIVDDTALCLDIENKMLANRNMPHPYSLEWYKEHFSFPVIDYYRLMGYQFEEESFEDISIEFNEIYNLRFHECGLMKGFMEKITEAIEKGYSNIILSASRQDNLLRQCESLGIKKYFEEILGIDNLLAGSKIEMAKRWMRNKDVSPKDCIYIGDSVHDYETADSLDIDNCWLVACGHQSYQVLKKVSDQVVYTLDEVILD
ncbi:MAG: HAD hydrolase-like protein [Solobacterium sp.]|nr:HAD hydrolase-like protein [Solobacterium sp.]